MAGRLGSSAATLVPTGSRSKSPSILTMNNVSASGTTSLNNSNNTGSGAHGYCLKWKFHPNNLLHMFNQLLLNESFTDVVVACEGKVIKCHKMVLSACSKYFEQVFCEYPQQNSTLVILKDMKFADVQAIIEFMYQGEINVAHDQLASLLKSAESLQVKGLADITGGSGGAAVNSSGNSKDDTDFMGGPGNSGEESAPPSPTVCLEGNSDGGSMQEPPLKRKRGRPPMSSQMDAPTVTEGLMNLSGHNQLLSESGHNTFEDFSLANLLETHYSSPKSAKRMRRKMLVPQGGAILGDMSMMEHDDDDDGDIGEDDDVTEEDIQNIVKMNDYIEKGGSRPQFWDEPTTKKIMNAIRSKKMEMKAAAEILGVSYSTLYSRYRELHGYLKMPHTQDTNFNYYQVLNLLRAGQISLPDAAKRLNIHEKTLGAYLSTTITPKKPRVPVTPSTSAMSSPDPQAFALMATLQGNQVTSIMDSVMDNKQDEYEDDDDDSEDEDGDGPSNLQISSVKQEVDGDGWGR